jgi:protein TonB
MFETVVPETVIPRSRRLLYETLPLSLALHAAVIAAAVTSALWTVVFPLESPRLVRAYSLVRIPDPPPPPPPPPPKSAAPQPVVKPAPPPPPALMQLAPTKIPDLIPQVVQAEPPPPPVAAPEPPPPPPGPSASSEAGPPGGVPGGEIGGKLRGVKGGVFFAEDGRVHVDRSEKLPMQTVEQEYPTYPEAARKARLEGEVLLRYIVGTDGRVKDVEVLAPAKDKMFDDAALNSVRRWRFRPMMHDGKRVEVVHEVLFTFEFTMR